MYRLVESLKVEDRSFQNINFHNQRLNHARKSLWGVDSDWNIEELVTIPQNIDNGVYKCRIVYGVEIETVEFQAYSPRSVKSLKLVVDNCIEYSFKYENREFLAKLFAQRGTCDDILIVKDGFITDTSFSNIVFLKTGKWFTPSASLLKGTTRQRLLEEGKIEEMEITINDIKKFSKALPINAMIGFVPENAIDVDKIF